MSTSKGSPIDSIVASDQFLTSDLRHRMSSEGDDSASHTLSQPTPSAAVPNSIASGSSLGRASHASPGSWTILSSRPSVDIPILPPPRLGDEDDDEWSLDDSDRDDDHASSWQEEAHWMSFQHAVQNFVTTNRRDGKKRKYKKGTASGRHHHLPTNFERDELDDSTLNSENV